MNIRLEPGQSAYIAIVNSNKTEQTFHAIGFDEKATGLECFMKTLHWLDQQAWHNHTELITLYEVQTKSPWGFPVDGIEVNNNQISTPPNTTLTKLGGCVISYLSPEKGVSRPPILGIKYEFLPVKGGAVYDHNAN